jgi:hypothetical protein
VKKKEQRIKGNKTTGRVSGIQYVCNALSFTEEYERERPSGRNIVMQTVCIATNIQPFARLDIPLGLQGVEATRLDSRFVKGKGNFHPRRDHK